MFERTGEMFELASSLMGDYRVYLLSNVGELHWRHLDASYGIESVGHGAIRVLPRGRGEAFAPPSIARPSAVFGLDPAATVFIDDLKRNVAGARDCGWHAIHHVDPAGTRRELRALGVRIPPPFHEE